MLTPRQTEILQLTADGCTVEMTAQELGTSKQTVRNQRSAVMEILGAENMIQAVAMGLRRKLII